MSCVVLIVQSGPYMAERMNDHGDVGALSRKIDCPIIWRSEREYKERAAPKLIALNASLPSHKCMNFLIVE